MYLYQIFIFLSLRTLKKDNIMMSGSEGQNSVRACTIRCLTLGPAKYEKVAIYVVNQRISNVSELRE